MSLSSSAVVSLASLEDHSRVSEAMITGDYSDCYTSLPSSIAQTFPFSSGNPRIEETRGVMRLFSNDDVSGLPEDNCCVLFIVDIQFTGYSGSLDTQPSPASTTEQPSCPVCLGIQEDLPQALERNTILLFT
ncbi:uncharacterized protein LOC110626791 isoform X1 [Manihot esculenta]|uniref:uncharacterized protein LOC110626791 isoform X1 n=1 Tax=Manihot esculenta TaxID=3983 RepID=UPI001CC47729|nr:uncharacterized protein LOC110626791 isoform X1 [Manihot esculenta]